jgi:hypothetical protein
MLPDNASLRSQARVTVGVDPGAAPLQERKLPGSPPERGTPVQVTWGQASEAAPGLASAAFLRAEEIPHLAADLDWASSYASVTHPLSLFTRRMLNALCTL